MGKILSLDSSTFSDGYAGSVDVGGGGEPPVGGDGSPPATVVVSYLSAIMVGHLRTNVRVGLSQALVETITVDVDLTHSYVDSDETVHEQLAAGLTISISAGSVIGSANFDNLFTHFDETSEFTGIISRFPATVGSATLTL